MLRIAINGYGRIGRVAHRVIIEKHSREIEVVAVNAGSSTDLVGWMNLLKYDSVYGKLHNHNLETKTTEESPLSIQTKAPYLGSLVINGTPIPFFSEKDPLHLPWKDLDVDVVIESTGSFTTEEKIKAHLEAGAKSAILSSPFKDEEAGPTYVLGVNLTPEKNPLPSIISNASCTTNSIAPVAHVIEKTLGIQKAMMTTVHGYTSDQRLQDGGHKDYRRARAAGINIIPTSTGATKATAKTIPSLEGIFSGLALRVPVPVGSLSDFTFLVKRKTNIEEVNKSLEEAANTYLKGILETTYEPIVSSDIIGNPHSAIADLSLTQVVGEDMIKVIAWYDNEFGYANRLVDEIIILGKSTQSNK